MACVTGTWAFELLVIGVSLTNKLWGSVRVLKNLENMLMVPGPGQVKKDNNRPHLMVLSS